MPAHNEEKRIWKTLDCLACLKWFYGRKIEVLVGLDGCSDNTEQVVKNYDFVKYIKTKKRMGKHYIIDKLIGMARGEIIAIMDADRAFIWRVGDLEKIMDCFNDPRVGGLGDYYTTTFIEENMKDGNALYLGDAWNTLLMLEHKIKNLPCRRYADHTKSMFYVNFFRKELVEKTKTLCDDGERFIQILKKGYRVRLLGIEERPNFKAVYNFMNFWGFVKTKLRGFIAQDQIDRLYGNHSVKPSISMFTYILRNLHRVKRLKALFGIFLWWLAIGIARIQYQFINKNISTREGWELRMS